MQTNMLLMIVLKEAYSLYETFYESEFHQFLSSIILVQIT